MDKPKATDLTHRTSSPDLLRKRSLNLELQKLDAELRSKQEDLDRVDSFYRDWKSLRAKLLESERTLSITLTSIKEETEQEDNLNRENNIIQKKLNALRNRTLHQQEASLKYLLGEEVSSSTKEIVEESLRRIPAEKKVLIKKRCETIANLNESYPLALDRFYGIIQKTKETTKKILAKGGIELEIDKIDCSFDEGYYRSLKDAQECVTMIKDVMIQNTYFSTGQAEKDASRKCDEIWNEMESMEFYKKKVQPFLDRDLCAARIKALDAAIKACDSETTEQEGQQEAFQQRVKDLEGRPEILRQEAKEDMFSEAAFKDPGFSEAIALYKAVLNQYEQALKALAKRDELQKALDENAGASSIERQHHERGIQLLETALADLKNPEKSSIEDHCRQALQQKDIEGYREAISLFLAIRNKNKALEKANNIHTDLNRQLEETNEKITSIKQDTSGQNDDFEFSSKVEAYIRARVKLVKQFQRMVDNIKSICDYYASIAETPLQEILSQNRGAIASIKNDIATHTTFCDKKREETGTIEADIEKMRKKLISEADRTTNVTFKWLERQRRDLRREIESLTSQQEAIRNRLGNPPESQETTLVEHDTDTTSTLPLKETARQKGASDQSLKWLEDPDIVADYTDGLRKAYFKEYKTAMNIDQAVASAKFLRDQKLVVEDTEKYMKIAADLVHEFGAALDNFHLNRKTFQVEIVDPSDTNANRRDLAPLRLSIHGDLLLDGKKLKGSVIASRSGRPYELILSIRGKWAFGSGTVMPQSGSGIFEDLRGLKKDGNRDICAEIAKREFAEEASGFEIVPETLYPYKYPDKDEKRKEAYIKFFKAEAKKIGPEKTITDTKEYAETVGTWTLDIMKMIEENQLDTNYDFHYKNEQSRFRAKKCILEAALKEGAIDEMLSESDPQWRQYFIDSYDVNKTVNYIEECIKKTRRVKIQDISWRARGEEKWTSLRKHMKTM
ncbi:MAG TPA: hypothetical protein VK553_00695 [Candidatus Nitrosopolaris rasttigaisensis]|nr:hypothetical protein [Candidatus Nitrosopolaris rasttigaisensis]